ncbi:MAG: hypothetical protein QOG53_2482 [Frankiales bacterium]|jgi:hypothetical protein|nr:hypothetical protein [Frankiales bacterium]
MRPRRIALLVAAAAISGTAAITAGAASSAQGGFAVGVPTVVDPVRGAGEPIITLDKHGSPWISGPSGTSTQTSWFWRSRDRGESYQLYGPSGGHWVCPHTGGGDSLLAYDKLSDQMYVADQEALASIATGRYDLATGNLSSACLATPAMTADRPFFGILHPAAPSTAPQWVESGNKPLVYMSWACQACGGGGNPGGLAFAWTDNGTKWHPADVGVPYDALPFNQFYEGANLPSFQWHGPTVVDQVTGYVYTGLSCSSSCDSGPDPEVGIAIGKPGAPADRANATNIGQFVSMDYQTAATKINGALIQKTGSLFPVIAMDSARTLYIAWIVGDGLNDAPGDTPTSQEWHLYYTYSKNAPNYTTWADPIKVDTGSVTKTSVLGWMVAGGPGKLGFIWLGTDKREQPSKQNDAKKWWPYMAVTTNGDTPSPTIQQQRVGRAPMNIGDICLQGTLCGVSVPAGNRNMADFISVDIAPDGSLVGTYASDANRIHTNPLDQVYGVPVTMSVHQVQGPKLLGSGSVNDSRFSTAPSTAAKSDDSGDGRYPIPDGSNVAQLDLSSVRLVPTSDSLDVHIKAANLTSLGSPNSVQRNVWWLVTWSDASGHMWFSRAQSSGGGAMDFHAGAPASYDRPGLTYYPVPTLVDYSGGTAITGSQNANEIVMHVPAAFVGSPKKGAVLESVTAWSALDTGLPPFVTAGPGNVPSVVDGTPAYNALLATAPGNPPSSGGSGSGGGGGGLATTGGGVLAGVVGSVLLTAALTLAWLRRRRSVPLA